MRGGHGLGSTSPVNVFDPASASRFPLSKLIVSRTTIARITQIIPVANIGLGCTLLYRAAANSGANAVVLASTGLLATLNLAVEDNARYASAKRALAKVENEELRNKRRELELSLANEYHISDRSKYELIRKIMDLLEDAMEEDKRLDDD